jgi:glycosyltransferase involved in cell wall biosynthesis
LRAARRILCVSAYTRDEMRRHCGLPESRFVVLPNALDPFFPIAGQPPSPAAEPVVLTVSRLVRSDAYKGIDHLIQAMPRIRQRVPGARLQVVGQGDDLPRLTALARSAGVAQCVEFLGYIGDQALQARLRECAIFALPSQREGFGLVFLEAMAQGRPCLAAQAGGVPEVLTPESGSLVPFGNVEALANAAAEALQRTWDGAAILARARSFSYPLFRERLKTLLVA